MRKFIQFIALFIMLALNAKAIYGKNLVIGYYRAWMRAEYPAEKIDFVNLTHIDHAFIWPNKDGSLHIPKQFLYPELIRLAHEHQVKVVISLGGWGHGSGFRPVISNSSHRKRFVRAITQFCIRNHYDGIDLDWEYPTSQDRQDFSMLIKELRTTLDNVDSSLTLSAALPSQDRRMGFDPEVLRENMDWIGIMTYDYHGSWSDHSGHQSPLYNTPNDSCGSLSSSIRFWLDQGIPSHQLAAGISFFGRMFHTNGFYQPSSGGKAYSFVKAESLQNHGWIYAWDSIAVTPYLQNKSKTQILSFDDSTSVAAKCDYILQHKLGGTIIWALGHDYSEEVDQPLLKVVGQKLFGVQK